MREKLAPHAPPPLTLNRIYIDFSGTIHFWRKKINYNKKSKKLGEIIRLAYPSFLIVRVGIGFSVLGSGRAGVFFLNFGRGSSDSFSNPVNQKTNIRIMSGDIQPADLNLNHNTSMLNINVLLMNIEIRSFFDNKFKDIKIFKSSFLIYSISCNIHKKRNSIIINNKFCMLLIEMTLDFDLI